MKVPVQSWCFIKWCFGFCFGLIEGIWGTRTDLLADTVLRLPFHLVPARSAVPNCGTAEEVQKQRLPLDWRQVFTCRALPLAETWGHGTVQVYAGETAKSLCSKPMTQTTALQILLLSPVLVSLCSFNKVGSSSRGIVAKVVYILTILFRAGVHPSTTVNSTSGTPDNNQKHPFPKTKTTVPKDPPQPQGGFYSGPRGQGGEVIGTLSTTWLSPRIWRGLCY